jgi:hypothetical protein
MMTKPLQFTLPSEVEEHYVRSLTEQENVSVALRGVMRFNKKTLDQKRAQPVTGMVEAWARRGRYRAAISAGIFLTIVTKKNSHWKTIAAIALERNELDAYRHAIQQHRAIQGRILALDALCDTVYADSLNLSLTLFNEFLSTVEQTRNLAVKSTFQMQIALSLWVVNIRDEVLYDLVFVIVESSITLARLCTWVAEKGRAG